MNVKSIITILAILIIPILAFFGLTFHKDTSFVAEAKGKTANHKIFFNNVLRV